MKKPQKISLLFGFFVLTCLYLSGSAFSEILVLKSGQTVEGKIIEETDKYIKINYMGVILTYSRQEIERIDNPSSEPVKIKIKADTIPAKEFVYKLNLSAEDIAKIISDTDAKLTKVDGGRLSSGYRSVIQEAALDIRDKINTIKRIKVDSQGEKLKELFVEAYGGEADLLIKTIDSSISGEELAIYKQKVSNKKKEYYRELQKY